MANGRSGEQLRDRFGLHQFARLLQVVIDDRFRLYAKSVIERRQYFHGMDRLFCGAAAGLVGLAVDIAAPDPGSGDD